MLDLTDLVIKAKVEIESSHTIDLLERVRIKYLGKKGILTSKITCLREMTIEERPKIGHRMNQAKQQIQHALNHQKKNIEQIALKKRLQYENLDISLPGRRVENGGFHPITRTTDRIEGFFKSIGFLVITGPEIEDEYHNFDALNIPVNHPVRSNRDTFWLHSTDATHCLLRTQTSCVQIRAMIKQKPPIRMITSGRVYRNDYDHTHTPMFHQMEGLIIDKTISFSNLKGMMHDFIKNYFEEEEVQIRFRASYFPFTEPSAEVDIRKNHNNGWIEVLGCGMVHPNVLCHVGINPEIYSGFAFGMGIERLAMLRYDVLDIRSFFENDIRFLKQFK